MLYFSNKVIYLLIFEAKIIMPQKSLFTLKMAYAYLYVMLQVDYV